MTEYKNFSDNELSAMVSLGDHVAYAEIYNRYKGILHLHAYKKLGDFEEAKDIVQELFTVFWDKRESIPPTTNLSGYLYTTLRNRIFNIIAHKDVESKYLSSIADFFNQGIAATDHLLRERELGARIEREIENLPPKMREVFLLSRKQNLSHKEIGEILTISESTVKNHIKGALKTLRIKLGLLTFLIFLIFY